MNKNLTNLNRLTKLYLVTQRPEAVPVTGTTRAGVVVRGGAWWCVEVSGGAWWCVVVRDGAWWCVGRARASSHEL